MKHLSVITTAIAFCALLLGGSATASAAPERLYLGANLPFAIPVGDFSKGANPGLGIIFDAEVRVFPMLGITLDLGFVGFIKKNNVSANTVPLLVGARYYHDLGPVALWGGTRIGMWHAETKISGGGYSASMGSTNAGWLFGAGVQYPIWKTVVLDGGLEFGAIDIGNFGKSMILMFTFGARYGFSPF